MKKTQSLTSTFIDAMAVIKDGRLQHLEKAEPMLKKLAKKLGLASAQQAIALVPIFDRQCAGNATDIDDIATYLGVKVIEAMQLMPHIAAMVGQGVLLLDNACETNPILKRYCFDHEVFDAIINGRDVKTVSPMAAPAKDQFDLCIAIHRLVDNRERSGMSTRSLMVHAQSVENEYAHLPFAKAVKERVPDLACRVLFYEMCNDFTERPYGGESDLDATLRDIFDRILDRASVKAKLVDGVHPLMTLGLITLASSDNLKITNESIRMLFGEMASLYVSTYEEDDRYEFVTALAELVENIPCHPDYSELREFYNKYSQFEDANTKLSFVAKLKALLPSSTDRVIFYLICNELTDGDTYSLSGLTEYCSRSQAVKIKRALRDGSHPLIAHNLVEVTGGGIFDGAQLSLTEKGKELFLEEDVDLFETKVNEKDLIAPDKVAHKNLYYEPQLQRQLSMLRDSIDQANYDKLCKRLVDNKMPKGVAVLFYGNPGTGKTESAMQIARATGRAVLHVDISATKTCWFGESEKLIKEVFTKYRRLCEKSKVKPILLFNEADAVFAKRKDTNSSSVAQTENAIQNIILEEMERLDGILIATTNLASNLDSAFERRFLFKVRFDRPTVQAKQKIWADRIPALTESETLKLAERYDFSGGEIDNVARKAIMEEVITGASPTLASLLQLCDEEKIAHKSAPRVGF